VTGPEAPGCVNDPVGVPWSSSAGYGSPKLVLTLKLVLALRERMAHAH
jgi:hypothetical protein